MFRTLKLLTLSLLGFAASYLLCLLLPLILLTWMRSPTADCHEYMRREYGDNL